MLNNLALALAMDGNAEQAETLLKQAVAQGGHEARVSQNLALVLSLQGKYEEAKLVGARQLSAEQAAANVDYVKRMVQLEPKPLGRDGREGGPAAGRSRASGGGGGATGRRAIPRLDHTGCPSQAGRLKQPSGSVKIDGMPQGGYGHD